MIESDDWGTIRMRSAADYDALLQMGYQVDRCAFNQFDCLESNTDLENLFETLYSVKDTDSNPAVLTANTILGNPDFEKIKASQYTQWYWERFDTTLQRYPGRDRVIKLYTEGIEQSVFMPQFHGREHVHVCHWLESLRQTEPLASEAFQREMFSISRGSQSSCYAEYLDALGIYSEEHLQFVEQSIAEGMQHFRALFGFDSQTAIAPCYIWNEAVESILAKQGVRTIQSGRAQLIPIQNGLAPAYRIERRFHGQTNKYGQTYSVRNVTFEPATNTYKDWVNSALNEISIAFRWNAPAIINAHRVNFMGGLNIRNRDKNLGLLKQLLQEVLRRWPQVRFVHSAALAGISTRPALLA